jgi:molybdopterin synthase catalytic subunit
MFSISETPLEIIDLKEELKNPGAGGFVTFEGWVRNQNEGRDVTLLEYEAYESMAVKEGLKILTEVKNQFAVLEIKCIHRVGKLKIGEMAVWVGVSSVHRGNAFHACEYIIDQVKTRLPIWKKEYYLDGDSGWVNCQECAGKVTGAPYRHA